jgi:aminoglycoside phosphotransferase (APT) family kinase protein
VTDLPGVDLAALTEWMDAQRPSLRHGELDGVVIAGGKSNLTYRVSDGSSTWALRRPPLAHVLPTAHDMVREFRVIAALSAVGFPVPTAVALCEDIDVLGAPFYLMSFVDGVVLDTSAAVFGLDVRGARVVCEQLVDTLVALHELDPAGVGLGDFGRPQGFLERQVRRWHAQWQASQTQERPELAAVVERLSTTLPAQSRSGIVHGDYRLSNVMYRPDLSRVAAVVDWEMATLGDPLCDLGLFIVYQTLALEGGELAMPALSANAGFFTPDEVVARYASGSSRDLDALDWYVGLGYFKLAVISEGIHHRYLQGKTVGPGFAHFGPAVPELLAASLAALSRR